MASFVSDFARRPLGVKLGAFAAIAGVLGLAYWQLGYAPIQSDITKARAEKVAELGDQKDLRKKNGDFKKLVVRRDGLSAKIEQNQKALPTEAEMPAFFDMLSRKITESGVEAVKRELKKEVVLDPGGDKPTAAAAAAAAAQTGVKTTFLKVPVEVEISGTFYQLKRFFASLRPHQAGRTGDDDGVEKDRLVTIENLTLLDPRVRNSEIVLTARFTASTFRAVTEGPPPAPAPPAAAPGAGTGSGSGSGSGSGPGSAPGSGAGTGSARPTDRNLDGPANTPAAVRAQTGAAAGTAERRNRSVDPDDPTGTGGL